MKAILLSIIIVLVLGTVAWADPLPPVAPINVPPINQPPIGNPGGPPRN